MTPPPIAHEARFDALLQQTAAGVAQVDLSGRYLLVNAYLCARLGYTEAELLQRTVADLTHPDDRAATAQRVATLAGTGDGYSIEKRYVCRDGSILYAQTSVAAVRDAQGRVQSMIGLVLDIGERQQAARRAAFLAELSKALATMTEADAIERHAVAVTGEFLGAHRCYFVECRAARNEVVLGANWVRDDAPSLAGARSLFDFGGEDWWRQYSAGNFSVADVARDPLTSGYAEAYRSVGIDAYAVQPFRGDKARTVVLAVTDKRPRSWTADELAVLDEVVTRVWPLIERARGQADAARGLAQFSADAERRYRLYETMLDATPDFVYVIAPDNTFKYANRALLTMWGRTWEETVGRDWLQLGYPDWHAAMHTREVAQVIATRQPLRGEVPFHGTHGRRIYDYIFMPVFGADGEVEAIAGTTRDVTERKQFEAMVAGQALVLELIASGSPLVDVLTSLCTLVVSQAGIEVATSIAQLGRDGKTLDGLASDNMPEAMLARLAHVPLAGDARRCGDVVAHGQPVAIADIGDDARFAPLRELGLPSCWSTPIFQSSGKVVGTFTIHHGIGDAMPVPARLVEIVTRTAGIAFERARAEDELHARGERLRLLWESAAVLLTTEEPDAMLRGLFQRIAPHFGIDTYLNFMIDEGGEGLRLESYAGVSEETARSIARLEFGQAICGRVAQHHEPIVATCIQQSDDEMTALVRGFGIRVYACNPLIADNRLLGTLSFASTSRDAFDDDELEFLRTVTRYVTVAYERMRLVRQLRETDRKKDDFIALLAHELRNPLAPLRNGLQVMRLGAADSEAVARAREMMDRQLGHMVRLVDDLLDVSRIGRNKLELRRATISLDDVVSHAVETARPFIESAQHRLEIDLPSPPVLLDGDLTRLAQVFSNLLTNSAKYTPAGGTIAIAARRAETGVVITVRDDGIGIPPEALPTIFDMFAQVDRSLERSADGLGIGLALVRGIVEMHGGTVQAQSAGRGRGSAFVVNLPVSPLHEHAPAAAPSEPARPAGAPRVLVADDNRDSAGSMMLMLELLGYDVRVAHDGAEAVAIAESFRPEAILMDVGMPRVDGHEATRRIRAQPWGASIVIVALTGWGQDRDRESSRAAGCDHHLVKPVDINVLRALLAEAITPAAEPS